MDLFRQWRERALGGRTRAWRELRCADGRHCVGVVKVEIEVEVEVEKWKLLWRYGVVVVRKFSELLLVR